MMLLRGPVARPRILHWLMLGRQNACRAAASARMPSSSFLIRNHGESSSYQKRLQAAKGASCENLRFSRQHPTETQNCGIRGGTQAYDTAARAPITGRRFFSSTSSNSFRIAIVGSGPSGCYTAKYLQSALEKQGSVVQIDVIERLPTPYGLVRFGVAPDHPEVKNVQNDFDKLFENSDCFRYFGNVNVGTDVSVAELQQIYNAVVLAYGCESDRKLGIPGEDDLQGVMSAREFVAWYNGHPDFVHVGDQVQRALSEMDDDSSVVVIGQGNVALDCARILAKGKPGLYDTDIAQHALDVIGNGASRVTIVGRRGHVQGAFTIKELRELVKLQKEGHEAEFVVRSDELDLGTASEASREELSNSRPKQRIDKLLRDAAGASEEEGSSTKKTVHLRFLTNPVEFQPDADDSSKLGAVVCERTELQGEAGSQRAVGTGQLETIPAQLALISIGYRAEPVDDADDWFDAQRGVAKHDGHGRLGGRLYTSGWLKRGPSGIIGTNIGDAKETVASVVHDLLEHHTATNSSDDDLKSLLASRNVTVVDWEGYRRIEAYENSHTRSESQPREKVVTVQKQLELAAQRQESSNNQSVS